VLDPELAARRSASTYGSTDRHTENALAAPGRHAGEASGAAAPSVCPASVCPAVGPAAPDGLAGPSTPLITSSHPPMSGRPPLRAPQRPASGAQHASHSHSPERADGAPAGSSAEAAAAAPARSEAPAHATAPHAVEGMRPASPQAPRDRRPSVYRSGDGPPEGAMAIGSPEHALGRAPASAAAGSSAPASVAAQEPTHWCVDDDGLSSASVDSDLEEDVACTRAACMLVPGRHTETITEGVAAPPGPAAAESAGDGEAATAAALLAADCADRAGCGAGPDDATDVRGSAPCTGADSCPSGSATAADASSAAAGEAAPDAGDAVWYFGSQRFPLLQFGRRLPEVPPATDGVQDTRAWESDRSGLCGACLHCAASAHKWTLGPCSTCVIRHLGTRHPPQQRPMPAHSMRALQAWTCGPGPILHEE
jgi:hypothetical protein